MRNLYYIKNTQYATRVTHYATQIIMPKYSNLSDIQSAIKNGKTSILQVVEYYLSRIEATQHLNAYVEVFAEEAVKKAIELDKKYRHPPR